MIGRNALTGINRILTLLVQSDTHGVGPCRNALTGINRILTEIACRFIKTYDAGRNALTGINRILTSHLPGGTEGSVGVVMPLRALIGF